MGLNEDGVCSHDYYQPSLSTLVSFLFVHLLCLAMSFISPRILYMCLVHAGDVAYRKQMLTLFASFQHADGPAAELLVGSRRPEELAVADGAALQPASIRAQVGCMLVMCTA